MADNIYQTAVSIVANSLTNAVNAAEDHQRAIIYQQYSDLLMFEQHMTMSVKISAMLDDVLDKSHHLAVEGANPIEFTIDQNLLYWLSANLISTCNDMFDDGWNKLVAHINTTHKAMHKSRFIADAIKERAVTETVSDPVLILLYVLWDAIMVFNEGAGAN